MANPITSFRKWYNLDRQEKVKAVSNVCGKVIKVYNATSKFASKIADSAGNTVLASVKILEKYPKIAAIAKYSKTFCILEAPFKLYHTVKHAIALVKNWSDEKRRTHTILKLVQDASKLTQIAAYFTKGLEFTGKISQKAAAWTTPVLGVSAVLSIARVASISICLYRTHQTQKKIDRLREKGLHKEALTCASQLDDFSIRKAFKIKDVKKFKLCLQRLRDNADRDMNREKMERVSKSLHTRITQTKTSRVLSIIASVINIIGVAILLFCLIIPIGYAILAVGGVLALGKFIFDQVALHRFKKSIEWDVKDKEIPMIEMKSIPNKVPNSDLNIVKEAVAI